MIILFLAFVLTLLSIKGMTRVIPVQWTYIDPSIPSASTASRVFCSDDLIPCQNDDTCRKKCLPEEKLSCVAVNKNKRYCLPSRPASLPCNEKLGGQLSWLPGSGWTCICTQPLIAGNRGCTRLNPGVCEKGTWTHHARNTTLPPTAKHCRCPSDRIKIVTSLGVPLCIPRDDGYCPNPYVCRRFYRS